MKDLYYLSKSSNPLDWQGLSEKDLEKLERDVDALLTEESGPSYIRAGGLFLFLLGLCDILLAIAARPGEKGFFDGTNYSLWIPLGMVIFLYFKKDFGNIDELRKLKSKLKEASFNYDTSKLSTNALLYLRRVSKRKLRQIDLDIIRFM